MPNTIADRISRLASYTTRSGWRGFGPALFSRSRRKMFSTSTMTSSTNSPIGDTADDWRAFGLAHGFCSREFDFDRPQAVRKRPALPVQAGGLA
ncbi:MAG: hypothetical protein JWO38_8209 [Gemmataceae bacterium]|nr:hypothetical protein [Gemmataceae bacterium]